MSCRLRVRVMPNAKKSEFSGSRENELLLRLNAPPVDGKANKAAIEFIAKFFGVTRASVVLVSGEKSRHKNFEILGLERSDIEGKLASITAEPSANFE